MIRLELAALIGLAAVLPLLEAPKSLFWALYVLAWFVNRARARDFGGPWDRWDSVIAAWMAAAFAAVAFGGLGAEWRDCVDVVRYGGVLWLMKRSRYSDRVLVALLVALAAGTLAALAVGYYRILLTTNYQYLGLKSVGHVNHSAIYLAIALGATLMATRAWWRSTAAAWRIAGVVTTILFAVSLFVMQSRAAVGAALVVVAVLLLAYAVRHRRGVRRLALAAAVLTGIGLAAKPQVLEKNYLQVERSGTLLSFRENIWRAGLLAWREHPVFGVGVHSWGRISEEVVRRAAQRRGERLDLDRLMVSSHGHSLYLNTLVEQGLVGLAALLAVLVLWAVELARRIPGAAAPPLEWSYWGGAAAAWLVAVIVGLVNTTLHHEHALISMLLLGGWLSYLRTSSPLRYSPSGNASATG
jgi:O-antigen ligase